MFYECLRTSISRFLLHKTEVWFCLPNPFLFGVLSFLTGHNFSFLMGNVLNCSVVSNSLRPHGLSPARLLYPWNFPGNNTGVGCHFLLQGIFPAQGSNARFLHLLYWQTKSFTTSTTWKAYIWNLAITIFKNLISSLFILSRSREY